MKIATVVPTLFALVFAVLYVLAELRISELEKEKFALEEEFQPKIATLESKVTALEATQAQAANSLDPDSSTAGSELVGGVPGDGSGSNPLEGFAKMMSDPGMITMMEQQTRMMVNGIYADILQDLGLDDETEATVKEIVTKKATIGASFGFKMMDKTLDNEGRKDIARELKDEMDELTEASKELLSEEQFEQLQLFEKSQPDRQALEVFKGSISEDVAELSYEQEEQMIALMYEERSNHNYSTGDFSDQMNFDPETLDDFNTQSVEAYLEETKDLHTKINSRASGVLDDGQMDAFRTSQDNYFKMQAMGMRMGAQMMESVPEE